MGSEKLIDNIFLSVCYKTFFFFYLKMLSAIFFILTFSIFLLFFVPGHNKNFLKVLGLSSSGLVLFLSTFLFINFDNNLCYFQNIVLYELGSLFLNFDFAFGFDGISIYFFLLTAFLFFLCVLFIPM